MTLSLANLYSRQWFEFFHQGIPEERTQVEVDFIAKCCPLPEFRRVLDVCCGMGRHARALAALGYEVAGVERDAEAVVQARARGGGPRYIQADVREYEPESEAFDAAAIMSQSFGWFAPEENRELLVRLRAGLRPGGTIILDVWNPDFFLLRLEPRSFELPQGVVKECKTFDGGRLKVCLVYPDGSQDYFDWQVFRPDEMAVLAGSAGLKLGASCTLFDALIAPSQDQPRIQYILTRVD